MKLNTKILKRAIATLLNSLNFHNNRIEALIDQLYGINKAITNIDSAFVKISDKARINRKESLSKNIRALNWKKHG